MMTMSERLSRFKVVLPKGTTATCLALLRKDWDIEASEGQDYLVHFIRPRGEDVWMERVFRSKVDAAMRDAWKSGLCA